MSPEKLLEIKRISAKPDSPKSMTTPPCKLCGWGPDAVFHNLTSSDLIDNFVHDFTPTIDKDSN